METKNVLILGSNGYLGQYLTTKLKEEGHNTTTLDSLKRRMLMERYDRESAIPYETNAEIIMNVENFLGMKEVLRNVKPDVIVNLAQEQCPGLSMMDFHTASETQIENINSALSLFWAVKEVDFEVPIIEAGTLGEFGYDRPERILDGQSFVEQGRMGTASFYHISKNQITLNALFCCKNWGLNVIDIQQTIVEGAREGVPLYWDGIFGTVVNRLMTQALTGEVLRYGTGRVTRSFLSLEDSMEAFKTVINNTDKFEGYNSVNQFDPDSVRQINELIDIVVREANRYGFEPTVKNIPNPRIEKEDSTVNVDFEILPSLGFKPRVTVEDEIKHSMPLLMDYRGNIDRNKIMPSRLKGWEKPKKPEHAKEKVLGQEVRQ